MPVYEYQCTACGQVEEAFQKISEAPLETCSKCQGRLTKLISQSSFHLKGSGWYVTDYGGKKTEPATKEKSTPKPSESTKTAAKKSSDPA